MSSVCLAVLEHHRRGDGGRHSPDYEGREERGHEVAAGGQDDGKGVVYAYPTVLEAGGQAPDGEGQVEVAEVGPLVAIAREPTATCLVWRSQPVNETGVLVTHAGRPSSIV